MKLNCDVIEHLVSLNKMLSPDFKNIPVSCSGFRKLSTDA